MYPTMRLHLLIQRNGLPTTPILWTVPHLPPPHPNTTTTKALPPPNASGSSSSSSSSSTDNYNTINTTTTLGVNASGASFTIAQLLEQVNDVVPLESGDWGLEDYAVEVGGFECLHYREVGGVGGVLRDGDVVCIRPLQTSDLRIRKFSGRHQITSDGKHLIDGVAFGRPFLKRPVGRPVVRIEARKRRRVLADEDGGGESEVSFRVAEDGGGQVVVRAGFEDADDEDEDDEEFDPGEGLEDEVDDLQELLRLDEEGFHDFAQQTRRRWTRAGLGLNFLTGGGYSNPLLDQYSQEEPSADHSAPKIQKRLEKSSSITPKSVLTPQRVTRAVSAGSNKSVRFEEQGEVTTPATEILAGDDDEDDEDDEDFDPTELDEDSTDVDESDKENTEPLEDIVAYNNTSDSSSSSVSDTSDEEDEDEDEDEDAEPLKKMVAYDNKSDSSSSSISDTSDDEDEDEDAEPLKDLVAYKDRSDSSSSSISDISDDGGEDEDADEDEDGDEDADADEDEDEDETSSSGISSSDSDSDSESDSSKLPAKAQKSTVVNGRLPNSSSASQGKADANRDKGDVTLKPANPGKAKNGEPGAAPKENPAVQLPVPPGAASESTKKRNMRRKVVESMKFHKANGDLPQDATTEDLIALKEQISSNLPLWAQRMRAQLDKSSAKAGSEQSNAVEDDQKGTSSIAAKRQELLDSLQSAGGIDVTSGAESPDAVVPTVKKAMHDEEETAKDKGKKKAKSAKRTKKSSEDEPTSHHSQEEGNEKAAASQTVEEASDLVTVQVPDSLPGAHPSSTTQSGEAEPLDAPTISLTPADPSASPGSVPSGSPGSQRPRSKLDLASSKRLLFGSLGLKAPKSKEDESALREKLMKDVKPIKPVKERVAEIEAAQANSVPPEYDDDSWKEKIRVAAVECCHEGIQYSAPPFPFVQRWDPQQQGKYSNGKGKENRKRKRKNKRRYEEGLEEHFDTSLEPESPSKIARQDSYDANIEQPQFDAEAFEKDHALEIQQLSHHQTLDDSAAASEQLLRESSECAAYEANHSDQDLEIEELRNLPVLSHDVATLPELTKEECSSGAVIVFKKFLMSAETNWQPGISEYLTAVVRELYENGTLLLTLAKRDQPKDEARYDEKTGERLYSKFEMPGYDDDNAGSDRSKLEMPFDELISPRLIRPAANKDHSGLTDNHFSTTSDPDDTLVGDEAQRAETEPQAIASFDSSMDHPPRSDADNSGPFESAPQDITNLKNNPHPESSQGPAGDEEFYLGGDTTSLGPEDQYDPESRTSRSPAFHVNGSSPPLNGENSPPSRVEEEIQAAQTGHTAEEGHADANEEPSALSSHTGVVEYPTLPQSHEESESVQNQRQHRSVSLNSEARATSPDFVSPPPTRRGIGQSKLPPAPVSHSQNSSKASPKPIGTLDGANDSSDEFPELFSQAFEARMSQEPAVKHESVLHSTLHRVPKAAGRAGSLENAINESASQINGRIKFRENDSDNDSPYRPSQSEVLQSSQVVDLTMSSDPPDSRYDDIGHTSSYQTSSGWVDKPNASLDLPVGKRSSKRKTRSRATMAY